MKWRMMVGTLLVAVLTVLPSANAATPTAINVQGRVTDAAGDPLPAGEKEFTFKIFNDSTSGIEIWPNGPGETQTVTTTSDGLWTAYIGALIPLWDDVFADSALWLEITLDDGTKALETLPRIRLLTGPFAFRVATVDGAGGGTITSKISIGPGHANTGAHAFIAGESNSAGGDHATIGGGVNNDALGAIAVIAGGSDNLASELNATVSGGALNNAAGIASTIGGGVENQALQNHSTVGGGNFNIAGGPFSTVPGGSFNDASNTHSFAAGFRARSWHDGSFVWADYTDEDFTSTGDNQFLIRANGGVGINTDSPGSMLDVAGAISTPVHTASGSYPLDETHSTVLTLNGATVVLPDAESCPGRQYFIKMIQPGASLVEVLTGSGDAIDGLTSRQLTVIYQSITVVSDGGNNWFVID